MRTILKFSTVVLCFAVLGCNSAESLFSSMFENLQAGDFKAFSEIYKDSSVHTKRLSQREFDELRELLSDYEVSEVTAEKKAQLLRSSGEKHDLYHVIGELVSESNEALQAKVSMSVLCYTEVPEGENPCWLSETIKVFRYEMRQGIPSDVVYDRFPKED